MTITEKHQKKIEEIINAFKKCPVMTTAQWLSKIKKENLCKKYSYTETELLCCAGFAGRRK